jgi:hypothetical protein
MDGAHEVIDGQAPDHPAAAVPMQIIATSQKRLERPPAQDMADGAKRPAQPGTEQMSGRRQSVQRPAGNAGGSAPAIVGLVEEMAGNQIKVAIFQNAVSGVAQAAAGGSVGVDVSGGSGCCDCDCCKDGCCDDMPDLCSCPDCTAICDFCCCICKICEDK